MIINEKQLAICKKYKAPFVESPLHHRVGIIHNVKEDILPINGERTLVKKNFTGWFIWAGETIPSSFDSLCVKHLPDWCPLVIPYLGLPPFWRFLITPNYEDVWYDAVLEEKMIIRQKDAQYLVEDLNKKGFFIKELIDLDEPYREAIPLLIAHLPLLKDWENQGTVARYLTIKEAEGIACKAILEVYHKTDKKNTALIFDCIKALQVTLTPAYIDDIVAILADEQNSEYHIDFAEMLCKWDDPYVIKTIRTKVSDLLQTLLDKKHTAMHHARLQKVCDQLNCL